MTTQMNAKLAFAGRPLIGLLLLCCLIYLDSCRDGKNIKRNSSSQSISSEGISKPHAEESTKLPNSVREKENPMSAMEDPDLIERQKLISAARTDKMIALKDELFSIPLRGDVDHDRDKAWETLMVPDNGEYLSPRQYKYACEILNKYADADPLEKLVFWRLVRIQLLLNGPPGISRSSDSRYTIRSTNDKLRELLYSALGQQPENLSYNEADNQAMEILRKATTK